MLRRVLFTLLVLAAALLPAQWVRRADIQGNITDVAYPEDRSQIYVATDGAGVWWWDGGQWVERNGGLPDLRVAALVVNPGEPAQLKAALLSGAVYKSFDAGLSWQWDSVGLDGANQSYVPTDLAMAWDAYVGQWYTYLATLGAGVFRQDSSGVWMPLNAGLQDDLGQPIRDILSVAAAVGAYGPRHQALAGTRYSQSSGTPGRLFRLDPNDQEWLPVSGLPSGEDYSIPVIAFHDPDRAFAGLTVDSGGTGLGVYRNGIPGELIVWEPVCSNPPDQSITALDYHYDMGSGSTVLTAGTPFRMLQLKLDPTGTCVNSYVPFNRFRGAVRTIGLMGDTLGIAGGPGKGPFIFNPSNISSPVANRRQGMQDDNVLDIATGPWFGSSGGDHTVFAASGIAGVYKNVDPLTVSPAVQSGYFYRMIGTPDEWGVPPVLKVKPVPNYNENGCQPNRTVFACTNGKGVMRSFDGGRSWHYANGGNIAVAAAMARGVVTDLVFHPAYDGSANRTLYASVYGGGVFQSGDNGDTWSLMGIGFESIPNDRVLCLAIGSTGQLYAGCRTLSGVIGQRGLFYWTGDSWSPLGNILMDNKSVSAIGLPPAFPTLPWIILGTENSGVLASSDMGQNFGELNLGLPPNAQIHDLQLAPYFNYPGDTSMLIAVRPTGGSNGGVYFTDYNHGWQWLQIVDDLPSRRVLSAAFTPTYVNGGQVFCGLATQGLYFAQLDPSNPSPQWLPASGFYNVPPNITGLSVSPDDPDLLFAATKKDGIFISRDGGDTFQPWGANLHYLNGADHCPVETTLSVAVTHQAPPGPNLFLEERFEAVSLPLFPPDGWYISDGGTPGAGTWFRQPEMPPASCADRDLDVLYPGFFTDHYAIIDSDCQGNTSTQDDWLVTPSMDTAAAERVLLQFNHHFRQYAYAVQEHGYVKVCSPPQTGASCADPMSWAVAADYTGQDFLGRASVDLTPWKGNRMQVAFHYTGAWDWWWAIDDVKILQLLPRVVVGTKDRGLYYADAGDDAFFGQFIPSNIQNGTVNEVRYDGISEDMRASHVPDGDYSSIDYGQTWTPVPGVTPGLGLRDVSYSSVLPWQRGKASFIWGVSSGLSLGRGLGDGRAWFYNPLFAAWQACPQAGLDPNGDYRSILQITSGTLLMGAIGKESGSFWTGLYRSEDTCATWAASGEGLPPSPKVYALQEDTTNGFVLASVVDSYLDDGDDGGIFYSDASSDGRAWALTNIPSSVPSATELASSGTTIYTGLSEDGIFSSSPSLISIVQPTAYYEVAGEACIGEAVQFHNYSAGKVTANEWDFDDGQYSSDASPTHAYGATGAYFPSLTVTSGSATDDYSTPVEVVDELDLGDTLLLAKTGTPGEVRLTWSNLTGESGYRVHLSNLTSGYQSTVDLPADTVLYDTTASYAYFRVQPLGLSYACGDGVIGGSW